MAKRHIVLSLLVGLAIITFLDRIAISVAGTRIQQDLHIDARGWGWILGAFVLAYGIFEVPSGALGDRYGQRSVLTRIVLWWSAFTSLTGAATGFSVLLMTRFLFGAGEAGAYPNIAGALGRWFPPNERARTQGYVWGASRLGGALAPLIVVPLQQAIGWRTTFFVLGVIGALWAVLWRFWYPDGDQRGPIRQTRSAPWKTLSRQPQLWLIFVMYFCYAWGSWFYFGWFPVYLVKGAGFSESEMGIFSALPFLCGAAGNLAGGYLCDFLVSRAGLKTGRRLIGCASLTVSALLLMAMTLTSSKPAIVALSSLGFGVADLMLPAAWAVCLDMGGEHSGVVSGVMNTAGQFGGFVCSVLFGYVVQATGSYHIPVWMICAMVAIAAFLFTRIDPTVKLAPAEIS